MQATITRLIHWTLAAGLAGLLTGQASCQGFLKADGERIVNGQGREVTLRGMGLGGWMLQEPYMLQLSGVAANQSQIRAKITDLVGEERTRTFYASWRAHQTRKEDIDSLASWGFNAVRMPLHYNLFTLSAEEEPAAGQQTWIQTGFDLTDSLLDWCAADHIYLILDLHAAPGGQGNDIAISDRDKRKPSLWESAADRQKTVALWQKLAERYASSPWIGGYDLLNETNWGFTNLSDEHGCAEKINAPLKQLLQAVTTAIRAVDNHHLIFIEGNCWANNFQGLLPLWDSNMAISFHRYWNNNDQASIQGVLNLRASYHVPLWLGESGENSNTWSTDAIALVEANHIGWTWWPLKKAGLNNPLEIHLDSGFRQIAAYWAGKAPRPSAEVAFRALMRQASGTSTPFNTYHKDVIDAMFRQVTSEKTIPFAEVSVRRGVRVYAVNYDLGRNGYAYYDLDSGNYKSSTGHSSAGNKGGYYRNDGVDIGRCGDSLSNGYAVTDIQQGEWLQYTVNVPSGHRYRISYRIEPVQVSGVMQRGAAAWELLDYKPGGSTVLLDVCTLPAGDGASADPMAVAASYTPPGAGEVPVGHWQTAGQHSIYLSEGVHHLRLLAKSPGFHLSYIAFE